MSEPIVALTIEAFEKLKRDHERLAWEVTRNQEAIRRVGAGVVGLPGSQVFVAKANENITAGDEGDFKVWDYEFGGSAFDQTSQIVQARDWLQTGFTTGDRAILCKHNQSKRWIAVKSSDASTLFTPSRGTLYRLFANEATQSSTTVQTKLAWYANDCTGVISENSDTLKVSEAGEYAVELSLEVYATTAYSGFTVELYKNGVGTLLADAYVRTTSGISFGVSLNRTLSLVANDYVAAYLTNDNGTEDYRWTGQLSLIRVH